MFRSVLLSTLLTAALAAQCEPTISQKTTLNEGWLCSTITYTYTVCVPSSCSLPVHSFRVKFGLGVGLLDGGSISSPDGWGGSVVAATDEVEWHANARASEIQPGQCKQFSITTNCNPRGIEGIQRADFFAFGGLPIHTGQPTSFVLAATDRYRNFLSGDLDAPIGQTYVLCTTSALDPLGANLVLASPFSIPIGIQIQGFGSLFLDPILIIPVAPVQIGPEGVGHLPLPIPPSTELIGGQLAMQALTFSTQSPRLSNVLHVTFR